MTRTEIGTISALIWVLFQFSACATSPTRMSSSQQIPAAVGSVKAEQTDNNNTRVNLAVSHLAPPSKISSRATTYVVWTRPLDSRREPSSSGQVQSLGALRVDQNLNGTLSAVTPLHNFELFITAESSGLVSSPSGEHLLWAQVNR